MNETLALAYKGVNVVEDWHDHEGLTEQFNSMLTRLTAITHITTMSDELGNINAIKVAVETAFQLGRQSMRED